MSETEDPAVTLIRLLRSQMHVVLDNRALASVNVSGEYPNSDALKAYDGQVTVALVDCIDQKLDLAGKTRQRTSTLRVNVWATDTPNVSETGKSIRRKISEEVSRIIRQNRTAPNQTIYSYVGLSPNGLSNKAFRGDYEAAPNAEWTELSAEDYRKLWYSDDSRCQISTNINGKTAALLFGFKLESRRASVKQAVFNFEGYGSSPSAIGVTVKVWNEAVGAWQSSQSNQAGQSDEILTLTVSANLPDFIDDQGYVWFLAETNGASDGAIPAALNCDYASCLVLVNGVTYCDIAGSRNLDRVDTKPPMYRTEFTVKSWLIEKIGE
jgi:hypothetical protein